MRPTYWPADTQLYRESCAVAREERRREALRRRQERREAVVDTIVALFVVAVGFGLVWLLSGQA